MAHGVGCPGGGLVRVAGRARVGNFVFVRHRWSNESKCVRADEGAGNSDLDFRHVTGHALASRGTFLMVSMFGKRRCTGTIPRIGAVAIQAKFIRGFAQLRVIVRAVYVVAVKAGDAAPVHDALRKIISLHAVLVRRAVWKMREAQLAERVILELPVVPQIQARVISDRPIVIFSFDRIGERTALRVALNASVIRVDVVHSRWI